MKEFIIGMAIGLVLVVAIDQWTKKVVDKHWDVIKPVIKKIFSLD